MLSWQRDVRYTLAFLIWLGFTVLAIFGALLGSVSSGVITRWFDELMTDSDQLAILTAVVFATSLATWFAAATGWLERATARAYTALMRATAERSEGVNMDALADVRRSVSEIMCLSYERLSVRATTLLLAAFFVAIGLVWLDRTPASLTTAIAMGTLYVLAIVRQAVLQLRIARRYFGNTEHEVRQLLWFVLRHMSPGDLSSGGRSRAILELGPDEVPSTASVTEGT